MARRRGHAPARPGGAGREGDVSAAPDAALRGVYRVVFDVSAPRYLARPPLSHDRLAQLPDGRLSLSLKTAWSDGTKAIVLSPMDLIARLCALLPSPRMHMTRFFGVLSSANKVRPVVVPTAEPDPELQPPVQLSLLDDHGRRPAPPEPPEPPPHSGRHPWAWLLRRVFKADVTVCPRCRGRMRIEEVALTAAAIDRVLARQGLCAQPPRLAAQ